MRGKVCDVCVRVWCKWEQSFVVCVLLMVGSVGLVWMRCLLCGLHDSVPWLTALVTSRFARLHVNATVLCYKPISVSFAVSVATIHLISLQRTMLHFILHHPSFKLISSLRS